MATKRDDDDDRPTNRVNVEQSFREDWKAELALYSTVQKCCLMFGRGSADCHVIFNSWTSNHLTGWGAQSTNEAGCD